MNTLALPRDQWLAQRRTGIGGSDAAAKSTTIHMPVKATPYTHQQEAFNMVCRLFGVAPDREPVSRGAALLMEMGTGKTITSIAVVGALFRTGRISKILIVSPLSIVGVWEEEFEKFADFEYALSVLRGGAKQKEDILAKLPTSRLSAAVVNYESAWRLEQQLLDWDADLIIADEGHKIKNHNISASKTMHKLGQKARYRLLLTGTVITNKALDVFSQYKYLNQNILGKSYYSFRARYFNMAGYGGHTPVIKRSMEPDLLKRIHSIAFRATKAECLDLPEAIDIVRYVELGSAALRAYHDLVRDSYMELGNCEITVQNVLARLLRLSQLTGGFMADKDGKTARVDTAKLDALEDIADEVLQEGGKLVVIARFIPEIEAIHKMLRKKDIGCALIHGGVKDREAQVRAFQKDPNVQVFIGQIATAGMGITLTAASTMVFYSEDYSMANFEQAKARIHRVGQRNNCTYLYLVAKDTVDEKILAALRDKAELAKALIDDYRKGVNPFI